MTRPTDVLHSTYLNESWVTYLVLATPVASGEVRVTTITLLDVSLFLTNKKVTSFLVSLPLCLSKSAIPNSIIKLTLYVDKKGNTYTAIAYFRIGKEIGEPSREYRQIVIQGATNCGLPRIYIDRYL